MPIVSTQWNDVAITFDISMCNNPLDPTMEHYITLEPFRHNLTEYKLLTNYAINPYYVWDCTRKYIISIPWTSTSITYDYLQDTESVQLTATVFLSFIHLSLPSC